MAIEKINDPGIATAWATVDAGGVTFIRDSYNITSVVDEATQKLTLNFTTAMDNVDYCVAGSTGENDTTTAQVVKVRATPACTVSAAYIFHSTNSTRISIMFMGGKD